MKTFMKRKAIIHLSKPLRSRQNKGSLARALSPLFSLDSKRAKGTRHPRRSCCCLTVRAKESAPFAPFPSPPEPLKRGKHIDCAVNVAVAPRERKDHVVRAVPIVSRSKRSASNAPSISPHRRGSEGSVSPRCLHHRRVAGAAEAKARSLAPPPPPVSMGDCSPLLARSALPYSRRRQTGRDVPPRPPPP